MIHTMRSGGENMNTRFRIKELRQSAGLTQAQIAFRLDLKSPSTVTMWETGDRKPPSTILPRLAQLLGVSVDALYEDTTEEIQ